MKIPLLASVNDAFIKVELITSQKQAVIKLILEKNRDKRFIKNWRPISLLNTRLGNILPDLISFNQTAYAKKKIYK